MAKQFSGFTQQQTEVLARKMGFKGPMDQFTNYLRSDPASFTRFQAYENKAKQMVESAADKRGFADGGLSSSGRESPYSTGTTTTTTGITPLPTPSTPNTTPAQVGNVSTSTTDDKGKVTTTNTPFVGPNPNSPGALMTSDMVTNPQNYTTPVTTTQMTESQNEMVNQNSGQVGANADVTAITSGPAAQSTAPTTTAAPQVSTATTAPAVNTALQGMSSVQGTVSAQGQVEAATALPSSDATVQGQITKLMSQFEGGATPVWAAGAIRNANAIMAQRGLGASSMAGGAVTQAAMESAIEIAARDAATFSQFELANLSNRQQARLQNAQAFLSMDLANLDSANQMNVFKSQSIIQGLFTDQAAENASRQFNATSQGQTDQFFSNLKTQVDQFNIAQKNAMSQFDTEQVNTIATFNRQMNDARDQFNAANRLVVDQSNATWRRQITTTNNENANEANRINAQAATGMTTAAYNNLMQRERDYYAFAFEASESAKTRAQEIVMQKLGAKAGQDAALGQALGGLAGSIIDNLFS